MIFPCKNIIFIDVELRLHIEYLIKWMLMVSRVPQSRKP
jgi:hypothetical protein